jgi:hypothetical protein
MADPVVQLKLDMTGEWRSAVRALQRAPHTMQRVTSQALRQEAEFLRKHIVEGIRDQAPGGKNFKPLSPYTIAMRTFLRLRGQKALIERGDLIRNVHVHKVDPSNVFVGIMRSASTSDGKDLVNIAKIHEFGAGPFVIRLTPKMRAFLAMVFRKMYVPHKPGRGGGELVITIPARPFIAPVFEMYGPAVATRMRERMIKLLHGVLRG